MATTAVSPPQSGMDALVTFEANQGAELRATVLRLTRHLAVFEIYSPSVVLRASEALMNFRIIVQQRVIFSGRATISSLVNVGTMLVCEVKLDEGWLDLDAFLPRLEGKKLREGFQEFLQQWHRLYKILPEYKTVVSDMQIFLADLRLWLDQVELGVRSSPAGDRIQLEHELALELGESTTPAIDELFQKFESVTERVEKEMPDQTAAHSAFAKRLLHPLLLSSPFLYRSFRKPLGYAGDYELVNMICRDPLEGSTLFAKMLNLWFLRQAPAEAHRNRINYLVDRLEETAMRAARRHAVARVLSLGCGPAKEVQRFLAAGSLADHVQFTLIDFDPETVDYTRATLNGVMHRQGVAVPIQVVRKSVNQILKEAGRTVERSQQNQYDLVYCAGLFDYLSDSICQRLLSILYEWVSPGGVLLSTNVDSSNPRRLTMNYIMDWHLIYRDGARLAGLRPNSAQGAEETVVADFTGVNIHYSIKKPDRG